ncbi:MAG: protein-methionine-sulfoxide reductase catalytic subunit MsrP [Acidobacteriaceae bacterium]|nr:protein-methionine-sulfoxide reductase catalytic subunit MsrP [Acidobacteriaceae bacterium]
MWIRMRKGWEIPEREATPESAFYNRRQLLTASGLLALPGLAAAAPKRNEKYTLDRPVTEEWAATGYNNYYEFNPYAKEGLAALTSEFVISPWKIEITGQVNKPQTLDLDDLLKKFSIEERLYRFRCVERWAMAVPWSGFPLSELIKLVEPKSSAKYLRFVTVNRPNQMPGMKQAPYPWPYFEGLRMDEAMNELTLLTTGMYGKPLPKQNGAPVRLVVPWKYGYKSIKSIVKIEFTSSEPPTFWNKLNAQEYGFYSNIDPKKPHPRWSQAVEQLIPSMQRKPTLLYNGYEQFVATMYKGNEF